MKIHKDLIQGTDDWLQARVGKITASRFSDVLAKTKSGVSKTRQSYMYDVIAEKMTMQPAESFTNQYMQWGTQTEPLAREFYQSTIQDEIEQVGFVELNESVGCSPDGLVGSSGLLEIKCPKTTTQIQRWIDGGFPSEYQAQVQGQLWICNREWCDFVSFDPRILTDKKMFKVRVRRDEAFIKTLKTEINQFIEEMNAIIEKLNK